MYIESNFVPFKCSTELRKNFPIFGIPHTIIINDNGEVIDRIAGYYPIDDFMEKLSYTVKGGENESAKREAKTYKDLKDAYEANHNDTEVALKYADKLLNTGDYKNAIPVYESITNITLENPSDEVWKYLNLATCYERVDRRNKPKEPNRKKAIECYNKAIEIGLTGTVAEAKTYGQLALLHFYGREYDEVIKYIPMIPDKEDREKHKDNYWVRSALRNIIYLPFAYDRNGEKEKGKKELEALFKNVINEEYSFSILWLFCEKCIYENLYIKEAVPLAKKAIELYNNYEKKERLKIEKITDIKEREKAEMALKSDLPHLLPYTYAQLSGLNGDYETAIKLYNEILNLPDEPRANYFKQRAKAYLAAVYIKSGQTEKGEKIFKEILSNWEDKRNAYFLVSLVCNEYKVKVKEALELTKEGIEKYDLGDVYWVTDAYAGLLYENGEIEKAIEWEEKAIEQMSEDKFLRNLEKFKKALK